MQKNWFVCINCPQQHKHFLNIYQAKRHLVVCKTINQSVIDDSLQRPVSNHRNFNVTNSNTSALGDVPMTCNLNEFRKLSVLSREANRNYYYHEQYGLGAAFLVSNSQFHQKNIASRLDTVDVNFQMRLSELFLFLSRRQAKNLNGILQYLTNRLQPYYLDKDWSCLIPTTRADVRQYYTDGAFSIIKNLPHPNVHTLDGHSYVPLMEIIQDCIGSSNDFIDLSKCKKNENTTIVTELTESVHVQNIIKNIHEDDNCIHLAIMRWSDDFEPQNVKQNRGTGIWTFTISICGKRSKKTFNDNTYIFSLGNKSSDHDIIERKFVEDFNNINDCDAIGFFSYEKKW